MNAKCCIRSLLPPVVWEAMRKAYARFDPKLRPDFLNGTKHVESLGLKWQLDMGSCISREILLRGVWEPETTKVVKHFSKPGIHALSVGANFGYYALLMAQQIGPTGHVWAFEPTLRYRRQLEWHINANGFSDRITIVPFGLSDKFRTSTIDLTPQSASMHYGSNVRCIGQEVIELKPLDSVMKELGIGQVGFISMDIDGHEASFLRGARETLSRDVPPIAMEFAQRCLHLAGSDVREVAALLREFGYDIASEKTREPYKTEMDFLIECGNFNSDSNALAIPKKT